MQRPRPRCAQVGVKQPGVKDCAHPTVGLPGTEPHSPIEAGAATHQPSGLTPYGTAGIMPAGAMPAGMAPGGMAPGGTVPRCMAAGMAAGMPPGVMTPAMAPGMARCIMGLPMPGMSFFLPKGFLLYWILTPPRSEEASTAPCGQQQQRGDGSTGAQRLWELVAPLHARQQTMSQLCWLRIGKQTQHGAEADASGRRLHCSPPAGSRELPLLWARQQTPQSRWWRVGSWLASSGQSPAMEQQDRCISSRLNRLHMSMP